MTDSDTPVRVFTYTPGRGSKLADKLFDGIREGAVLMTDGYAAYDGIAQRHRLVHLACWTHARRGFVKAEDNVLSSSTNWPTRCRMRSEALTTGPGLSTTGSR